MLTQLFPSKAQAQSIIQPIVKKYAHLDYPDTLFQLLSELFESLIGYKAEYANGLEPSSVLGIFVHEMHWAFRNMLFDQLANLWNNVQHYSQGGSTRGVLSEAESEIFIAKEAEHIESLIGHLSRLDIDATIGNIRSLAPGFSKVHFLSYMSDLYHGDYASALDNLHKYFDNTIRSNVNQAQLSATLDPDHHKKKSEISLFNTLFPYITLSMAAIHIRFGHLSQALELVAEALPLVQQRADDVCMAHAFFLLAKLAEKHYAHGEQLQWLKTCLSRALVLKEHSFTSQVLVDLSNNYLIHWRDFTALDPISLRSKALGAPTITGGDWKRRYPESTTSGQGIVMSWRMLNASMVAVCHAHSLSASLQLKSASLLARANTWNLLGYTSMAAITAQLQIHTNGSNVSMKTYDSNTACGILASHHLAQGDWRKAICLLLEANRLYPQSVAQISWIRTTREMLFEIALHQTDWRMAQHQITQLMALTPLHGGGNIHYHIDVIYRLVCLLVRQDSFHLAITTLHSLIEICWMNGLHIQAIGFQLTLAEIYIQVDCDLQAMPHILKCLNLSETFQLEAIRVAATVCLANIHMSKATFQGATKALNLLESVSPYLLDQAKIILRIRAQIILTKAQWIIDDFQSKDIFYASKQALKNLQQAVAFAIKVQNVPMLLEIYYLQARFYDQLEMIEERNAASKAYLKFKQKKRMSLQHRWRGQFDGANRCNTYNQLDTNLLKSFT